MGWGQPKVPLLPLAVRTALSAEVAPAWICLELGLPAESTFGRFDDSAMPTSSVLSDRARDALGWLIGTRRAEIAGTPAISCTVAADFDLSRVPWDTRTRNAVKSALWSGTISRDLTTWSSITIGDILALPSIGTKGFLDFACSLEAVLLAAPEPSVSDSPAEPADPLLELLAVGSEGWAEQASTQDPRFANALIGWHGTVRENIEGLLALEPLADASIASRLLASVLAVRDVVASLPSHKLETELFEMAATFSQLSGGRCSALCERVQWSGSRISKTLEEAAAGLGVTRERMRQLQLKLDRRLPSHPVFAPSLARAVQHLRARAPMEATTAAESLQLAGISDLPFHPASVIAAANRLRHEHGLVISNVRGVEMLSLDAAMLAPGTVAACASRLILANGATSVSAISEALDFSDGEVGEQQIRDILKALGGFSFLNEQWFCAPDIRGDFVNRATRRMLSVVSALDTHTLRDGLARAYRFRASSRGHLRAYPAVPPPRDVLAHYFRSSADFVLAPDGTVRSAKVLDAAVELSPAERVLVESIRAIPTGVIDRLSLVQDCERRGLSPNSTTIYCSYSPIMYSPTPGLWSLRGAHIDPVALEGLRRSLALRPTERRITDHGWREDGRLYFACRSPRFQQHLVIKVPAAICPYLKGRTFAFFGTAFNVRIDDEGIVTGYKALLRGRGADEGDALIFSFDLVESTATLTVDSAEALTDRGLDDE